MWSSVLGLALMGTLNPVRLGVLLLLISRERPAQNLIVFWAGCVTISLLTIVCPILLLHFTPVLAPIVDGFDPETENARLGYVQIGIGIFALTVAASIAVRLRISRRKQMAATRDGLVTVPGVGDDMAGGPDGISDRDAMAQARTGQVKSVIRRVLQRGRKAWDGGSLWIGYVVGLGMGPAPEIVLLVLAIIVTSGAAVGAQLTVALAYIAGVLAVVELVLLSYLVAPARTEPILRRVRNWSLVHREHVLAVIFTVVGVSAVLKGMSGI
ncbi:GAP family protein [Mycolicibacterium smegmatis]|nr:GAP family protein [Mycolicibacterium smegmatis]